MNKKGFTLVEVLTTIVIITLITLIVIPSIIAINNSVKKRMLKNKEDVIVASAELYATNNPDIFNGQTEVKVTVRELISRGFLNPDAKNNEGNCINDNKGCLINPVDKSSMNDEYVIIIKQAVGVKVVYKGESCSDNQNASDSCATGTLVKQVCEKFSKGKFIGKYGTGENEYCTCKMTGETVDGIYETSINADGSLTISNTEVDACIITGDDVDNYLEYDNVMFRVVGLYKINKGMAEEKIVAKIITNDTIDN